MTSIAYYVLHGDAGEWHVTWVIDLDPCPECRQVGGHRPLCARDPINRTAFGRRLARARDAPPLDRSALKLLADLRQLAGFWVTLRAEAGQGEEMRKISRLQGAGLDIRTRRAAGMLEAKLP